MADALEIYIDVSTPQGRAVTALDKNTTFTLGPFYQGSLLPMRVWFVTATGSQFTAPFFTKLPIDNMDFQLVVGPRAGSENILAAQYVWAKQIVADSDLKSGYFYATLDLNTTNLNNAISTADSYNAAYFEFRISRSGAAYTPVHQINPTIVAVVKDPAGAASIPTPVESYLTIAQAKNLFVMWNNLLADAGANNGRTITLVSPDGSNTRELGVDNDGSPIDNVT